MISEYTLPNMAEIECARRMGGISDDDVLALMADRRRPVIALPVKSPLQRKPYEAKK